jgi:hypothetical protein
MRNATTNKFLFIGVFSELDSLARKAILRASVAHAVRADEEVRKCSKFLISLGLPACTPIGAYYAGLATLDSDSGDNQTAKELFELAANDAPFPFNHRASMSLSVTAIYAGDYNSARQICEKIKTSSDHHAYLEANMTLGMLHGYEGDSIRAAQILENLYPEIKSADDSLAHIRAHYYNNLAVELKGADRLDDAKKASSVAIASPLARVWSEFGKTAKSIDDELAARERNAGVITGPWKANSLTDPERINQVWRIKAVTKNSQLTANDLRVYANAGERALFG